MGQALDLGVSPKITQAGDSPAGALRGSQPAESACTQWGGPSGRAPSASVRWPGLA